MIKHALESRSNLPSRACFLQAGMGKTLRFSRIGEKRGVRSLRWIQELLF